MHVSVSLEATQHTTVRQAQKSILQVAREGFDQLIATGLGALETKYVIAQLCILFCVV